MNNTPGHIDQVLHHRSQTQSLALGLSAGYQAAVQRLLAEQTKQVVSDHAHVEQVLVDSELARGQPLHIQVDFELAVILLAGTALLIKKLNLLRCPVQRGPVGFDGNLGFHQHLSVGGSKAFDGPKGNPEGRLGLSGQGKLPLPVPGTRTDIDFFVLRLPCLLFGQSQPLAPIFFTQIALNHKVGSRGLIQHEQIVGGIMAGVGNQEPSSFGGLFGHGKGLLQPPEWCPHSCSGSCPRAAHCSA